MKKNIFLIAILFLGFFMGWVFFGKNDTQEETSHQEIYKTKSIWTCSMHSQVKQREKGSCPLCGMELIPETSSEEMSSPHEFKLTRNAMALANIQTVIVGSSSLLEKERTVKLSGIIQENETKSQTQISYVSGRIETLSVTFVGEYLKKGQLLGMLYSPELIDAQKELLTAFSLKKTNPEWYLATRKKMKLWKLSEKEITKIESSGKIKEYFPVYADVSGTVSKVFVQQGDYIKKGQTLFALENLSTVWGVFDAYENQLSLIKGGEKIEITTKAHAGTRFTGSISFISPTIDTKTRTAKVRVELSNKKGNLKPGMFIEGLMKSPLKKGDTRIFIPITSVLWTGKRSIVYLKKDPKEPVFELQEVLLGKQIGEMYVIKSGLKKGDEIVTNGAFTVDATAQLQGKKSMMNMKEHSYMTNTLLPDKKKPVSPEFQKKMQQIVDSYLKLKDALVNDDSKTAKNIASFLTKDLPKEVFLSSEKGEVYDFWTKTKKNIEKMATEISKSDEIKNQRSHFKELSINIISMVKVFGSTKILYEQYCPMVDNDKGGSWLSKEKKVFNPYFGSSMLRCGKMKKELTN